jgi:hypothetical protein
MTQLAPRSESFGAGDQSWLGSRSGTDTAKTITLNISAWSAKISSGRIKSGEPYALVDGLAVPYNKDATVPAGEGSTAPGPAATLAGFILTDQSVTAGAGNLTAPAIWTGRIILSKLPSPVLANAVTSGLFVLEA